MARKRAAQAAEKQQIGELERLGPNGRDALVLGLDAPGLQELPASKRILAYYLYRAAIAGNDIMYMQNHRYALEVKDLLETVYLNSDGMETGLRDRVHDYLKYVWIHHGNYHHYSHTKFIPNRLTRHDLDRAVEVALANGAKIETGPDETIDGKLGRLARTIFDAEYEKLQSNTAPDADVIATSAVNFWDRGVTAAELEALPSEWTRRLNVRFARRDGAVVPEVFKIGGVYSAELETVSHFLELALPYAETDDQRRSLELLLEYYRTGEEETFRRHCIHWLKSDTTVDYVNGFIEQYIDPRGIIANFEANVNIAADTELAARFAESAPYFERRMPWPDEFKRRKVDPPVVKVVNAVVETGDGGPVSPAAYNLPNYNDIRRDHGSKNVIFLNVENTSSRELLATVVDEFYLPEYKDNVMKFAQTKVRPLEVYMHEIIGHGSGQPDPSLGVDPRAALGAAYAALEECRSDLVALYHMSDPKLVEIGACTAEEQRGIVDAAYITYTQGWMTRFHRVEGGVVREAHNKGHQLILMYLIENGGDAGKDFGLDVIDKDGDFYVQLRDGERVREGMRELLCRLQVMKSTGDGKGAAALFDRFGTRIDPAWYANMVSRTSRLNIPKLKAFVFPHLRPVIENGAVTDVTIAYDEDLTAQQLRFSRLQRVRDIEAD